MLRETHRDLNTITGLELELRAFAAGDPHRQEAPASFRGAVFGNLGMNKSTDSELLKDDLVKVIHILRTDTHFFPTCEGV